MEEKAHKLLDFFKAIEPLKSVTRHSWRMASMAFPFEDEFPELGYLSLSKISKTGDQLVLLVRARSRDDKVKYLAFYHKSTGNTRSSISGANIAQQRVHQVYLWQGQKRAKAYDAYRGVPVQPGGTVIIELIFSPAPRSRALVSKLNLVAYVGSRSIIRTYSWQTRSVLMRNIQVP